MRCGHRPLVLALVLVLVVVVTSLVTTTTAVAQPQPQPQPQPQVNISVSGNTSAVPDVTAAEVEGDVILGGMFPVHRKSEVSSERCGSINPIRGVQRVEAMLWAIDQINSDKKRFPILPGIKLGAKILDSCSRDTYALEQALEFVRDSLQTMDASQYECADGSTPKSQNERKPVIGVVGEALSEISVQIANLLRLFRIPQISYASTSTILSDKTRYDFFARTLPPDSYQATAMADVAQMYKWTYVSTIASEGEYGESGINAFIPEATKRGICIAVQEKFPASRKPEDFDRIFTALQMKPASVVVLFLIADDVTRFIDELVRRKISNKFVLFASDGWGTQVMPAENIREYINGMLTIELQSVQIADFDSYFRGLRPLDPRNPWLKKYWEESHSCDLPDPRVENKTKAGKSQGRRRNQSQRPKGSKQPKGSKAASLNVTADHNAVSTGNGSSTRRNCTMREGLPSGYKPDTKVQFIYDAVLAFAYAVDRMQKDLCPNTTSVCPKMEQVDGATFFRDYILTVNVDDFYGNTVKFDKNGDSAGRYNILNFRKNRETKEFNYEVVAVWNNGLQSLNNTIVWPNDTVEVPMSRCSQPCQLGSAKQMTGHDFCCWICVPCAPHQYLETENLCVDCADGYWPTADRQSCSKLPELYMEITSVYSLIPIAYSCLGILLTMSIVGIYIKYNDTPVIKASGRELSFFILGGCFVCYVMSLVILARPNGLTCAIQRFGIGFGFAIIYAAMLTKTNRIYRIFESATRSARRPPFISPRSQMVISCLLISVQVAFSSTWLIFERPETRLQFQSDRRDMVVLRCKYEDLSFFISLTYIMVLITVCTIYAILSRKIPENFNESKFIGFTMYTTCIVWLAFVPIYFATVNSFEIQTMTLCVSINMNSTVVIACLFLPKMYIIIFHPDKNVRKVIIKQANSSVNHSICRNEPTSSTSQCGNGTSGEYSKGTTPTGGRTFEPMRKSKEKEAEKQKPKPKEKQKDNEKGPEKHKGKLKHKESRSGGFTSSRSPSPGSTRNPNLKTDPLDSYPIASEITRVEMTKEGKIVVRVINGEREEVIENEFVCRRSQLELH